MTQMYDISNYDPGAFLTNLKNKALQKYNQQMGASGTGADIAVKTASLPNPVFSRKYNPNPTGLDSLPITGQEILQGFNKINPMAMVIEKGINLPEINELEYQYGPGYTGKPSDARHMAAANNLSNVISNLIEKGSLGLVPESVSTFIGDATPNVAGGIKELISLGYNVLPTGDITPSEAIDMFKEDIAANYQGSFGIPQNTMTAKDIYEKVYSEPQEGLASLPEAQLIQANTNINPLDYDNLFDFYGDYLRPYIAEEQPGYRTFIGAVSPGYIGPEGEGYNPTLYEQYIADRARGKEIFNTRFD